jgi:SAM-dependent methyltransferase
MISFQIIKPLYQTYIGLTLLHKFLPESIKIPLFGNRKKYGLFPLENDEDWNLWLKQFYYQFYKDTQKKGVSKIVNDSGYKILKNVDMVNKFVLEIGPGDIPHSGYWVNKPQKYYLVDIRKDFLTQSKIKLSSLSIENLGLELNQPAFPFKDNSIDIIIAFYVLEHLYPLEDYMREFFRILKPQGMLIGGIPTEGGIGWGIGRYFSSRKYVQKHSVIDYDKIICWEHPNFAAHILKLLNHYFIKAKTSYWPFKLKIIDINLIIRFIFKKI